MVFISCVYSQNSCYPPTSVPWGGGIGLPYLVYWQGGAMGFQSLGQFTDVNGDGLMDYAWGFFGANSVIGTQFFINTGCGFVRADIWDRKYCSCASLAGLKFPEIMTLDDASSYLGVDEREILKLFQSGEIKSKYFSGGWRVHKAELDNFMRS